MKETGWDRTAGTVAVLYSEDPLLEFYLSIKAFRGEWDKTYIIDRNRPCEQSIKVTGRVSA